THRFRVDAEVVVAVDAEQRAEPVGDRLADRGFAFVFVGAPVVRRSPVAIVGAGAQVHFVVGEAGTKQFAARAFGGGADLEDSCQGAADALGLSGDTFAPRRSGRRECV